MNFLLTRHNTFVAYLTICTILFLHAPSTKADWSVVSQPEQAELIELFTSQGCSSCPPADTWLTQLKENPQLFKSVVPISFHVTYWDYLGWQDPFGQQQHDVRHRLMAKKAGTGVYTPGVFRQGKEFRAWRNRASKNFQPSSDRAVVGTLSAQAIDQHLFVSFQSNLKLSQPRIHLAILGSQQTRVRAGENKGRVLHHDFIARSLTTSIMHIMNKNETGSAIPTWSTNLPLNAPPNSNAIAIWVVDKNDNYIQAAGGYFESN